jgi:hypothetical protein
LGPNFVKFEDEIESQEKNNIEEEKKGGSN